MLERSGISVGVVSGIAAPIRFEITIHGKADHSGATPMNMRSDALLAASHIIIAANKFAKNKKQPSHRWLRACKTRRFKRRARRGKAWR